MTRLTFRAGLWFGFALFAVAVIGGTLLFA